MRNKQKDAYYFSHDSNARNDEKILEMRADYGHEGYGLFFMIIEVMRDATEYKLQKNKISALSLAVNYPADKLEIFINDCITKYKLFELKGDKYQSNRLLRSMRKKEQLSCKMRANALQLHSKSSALKERKGKEIKVKDITLFSESKYSNFNSFKTAFESNVKYQKYDVNYYYEAVKNWSEGKGEKKKDWIATARGFANRDEKDNKAKLKPISYKSNHNGIKDPSTAHL